MVVSKAVDFDESEGDGQGKGVLWYDARGLLCLRRRQKTLRPMAARSVITPRAAPKTMASVLLFVPSGVEIVLALDVGITEKEEVEEVEDEDEDEDEDDGINDEVKIEVDGSSTVYLFVDEHTCPCETWWETYMIASTTMYCPLGAMDIRRVCDVLLSPVRLHRTFHMTVSEP